MDKKLAMVRMHELSKAYVDIADELIESDVDDYFKHMLGRSTAIMARISECSNGKKFEWDEQIAMKMWLKEMAEELTRFDNTPVLAVASKQALNKELDSILRGMKDIEPKDVDTAP